MTGEMNHLSDYILKNVEKRVDELNSLLNIAGPASEKIDPLPAAAGEGDSNPKTGLDGVETALYPSGRQKEITELYKKGLSYTDIARKLNMGKGEVQMILGLNSSRGPV
jgi:DNA-binding NarL/FixJ family response regulator